MHEAALAQLIAERASERAAAAHGVDGVSTIFLRVGEFRNVDPDSLGFAFDSIKTLYRHCRDAKLKIDIVKPLAVCRSGHSYSACSSLEYRCPDCSSGVNKFLTGEELEIVGIDFVMNSEDKSDARDSQRAHIGAPSGVQRGACST